jgi:hypothetical protein
MDIDPSGWVAVEHFGAPAIQAPGEPLPLIVFNRCESFRDAVALRDYVLAACQGRRAIHDAASRLLELLAEPNEIVREHDMDNRMQALADALEPC